MKEKLLWATLADLGILFAASHAQSPAVTTQGRYQVTIGPAADGGTPSGGLYLTDTTTGRIWSLGTHFSQDANGQRRSSLTWIFEAEGPSVRN
jgi:hypothetical protein